jgi:hypothetical protein
MANARKRILELTPLPSASLNTTIVGVDNGTTYKIELDVLADAVTSRVNILDRDRLASLESVTSSFESKGRSVISSSAQITAFGFISSSVTIPTGTISSSAQITSFGFISQSVDITSLNSFTSSQQTLNTAFTNGISARLQTSSFNDFSTSVDSRIIAATNEQSLTHLVTTSSFNEYTASQSTSSLVNRLNAIESVSGSWITESETGSLQTSITNLNTFTASVSTASLVTSISNLNSATSSYLTSLSGAISSSSQLTSSFDTRYALSASFVSSSNVLSMRTITSASYAALTPVSGTLYIIIG